MDRLNKIERLKDELHDSDYKAIKHSEGWLSDEEYAECKAERQSIREEINRIEEMTDEEFYEAYPEELNQVLEEFSNVLENEEIEDEYDSDHVS